VICSFHRIAILAAACLFCISPAAADEPSISIQQQAGAPGSSLLIPALFAPQSGTVAAIQFDVEYDPSAMSLGAVAGDAARSSGKSVYFADLGPNRRRFLLFGWNQNLLEGGSLVDLYVNLNPSAPDGSYALSVSNVIGADPYARPAAVGGGGGSVAIQGSAGQGASLQIAGVLNAGSLLSGPVAPGEIITLLGSGIGPSSAFQPSGPASATSLAGTSVWFDATAAPLLFAAPNQINLIVPFEVDGQNSTQLRITSQNQTVAVLSLAVSAAAPSLFTADASGAGQGAILNQDTTLNSASNPAQRGSVVVLYATGAGQMNPAGADGAVSAGALPAPNLPVSVKIGGADAAVVYAGAAPGLIAGVIQVNCVVPADVTPGTAVPVALFVGTAASQPGVTLAIQ